MTRVTTDVDALNELFTSGLIAIFGDVLVLAGIVGVLFWLNWRLALVAFSIVPLLFLLTSWFRVKVRDAFRAFEPPSEPRCVLVSSLDSICATRREVESLVAPADRQR